MALTPIQRRLLRLIDDGTNEITGWTAPINNVVWPLIKEMPPELVEIDVAKRAKLTEIGKLVLQFL